ncbi:MAG: hypothetical protein HN595_07730 [Flavobacteriaceae bacterium]|nr:hypothetical protein [Flavobacteriaceae bacterium]
MKKIIYFLTLMVFTFSVESCKTVTYAKEENLVRVVTPFEQKDFPNTVDEFYTIQNAKGNNMNILRNRVLMMAKTQLAGEIKTRIVNIANQQLVFNDSVQSEAFDQKSTTVSNLSMAKIMLVDSEVLREKDGTDYDYWVVYKILLEDVVEVINSSDLGITINGSQILQAIN